MLQKSTDQATTGLCLSTGKALGAQLKHSIVRGRIPCTLIDSELDADRSDHCHRRVVQNVHYLALLWFPGIASTTLHMDERKTRAFIDHKQQPCDRVVLRRLDKSANHS